MFNIPKATDGMKKYLLNCFIFLRLYLFEAALMHRVSNEESTKLQNQRSDSRLFHEPRWMQAVVARINQPITQKVAQIGTNRL